MARTTDTPHSPPDPAAALATDLALLQTHLNLPATGTYPSTPLTFLTAYLDLIPPSLTHVVASSTTPRERSRLRGIKARRMVWAGLAGAQSQSRPRELSAEEGWRRWPLLWERLGGDPRGPTATTMGREEYESRPFEVPQAIRVRDTGRPLHSSTGLFGAMDDDDGSPEPMSRIPLDVPPPVAQATTIPPPIPPPQHPATSSRLTEESTWPTTQFMPSAPRASVLQVNRLGDLMRDLEEEREAEDIVAARRRERHAQTDAEREEALAGVGIAVGDEREVVETFERILLELFLDGKDMLPYDVIDFTDPQGGNPLLEQDKEDAYFDDEDEVDLSTGDGNTEGALGEGEYDY